MSGVRCFHVSIDEMAALNDRLAFTFRSLGLNDHELDEAIAASLHPALRVRGETPTDAIACEAREEH